MAATGAVAEAETPGAGGVPDAAAGAGVASGLRALGLRRLLLLGVVGLAVLGLVVALAMRAGERPMAPLYAELDQRDAGAVVAALERARVPFRVAGNGAQILVAAEEVPRLRLMMAREGLPSGGGVGWEIFDRTDQLTTTPFQQDVNRLRALEGELARTIRGLSGVRAARVHLVLPRREAFSRDRGEAQASVVLAMQGSQRLDKDGVQAVLHLVATAVPGLKPENVSIVDSRGALLARGGQALSGPAAAQTQDEMRHAQELRISRAVEELLERTLGPGRVRAEATVDMDFDKVQTTEERFDPDNQVPRSQQSVTENNRNTEPQPTSVATNLPGNDPPQGAGSQENRQEETTNFEIGRSTRNTVRDSPVVRRLSIAVLVDGLAEPQPGGPPRWRERTPEELARIAALVRAAAGADERRGDRVEVVSMRFQDHEVETPEAPGLLGLGLSAATLARLAESGLLAIVALLAILLLGRPLVRRLGVALAAPPARPALAAADGTPALTADGQQAALPPSDAMVSLANVAGKMRASSLQQLALLVEKHPDETLAVMRRWLTPAGAA